MRRKFEQDVLNQVYYFLKERMIYDKPSPHLCVIDFFSELHLGTKEQFQYSSPSKIHGNFGEIKIINLINVPDYSNQEQFVAWAHKILN